MKQSKNGIIKRIRFHGRGGQGMKTASRIVGTDACAIIMVKHNRNRHLFILSVFDNIMRISIYVGCLVKLWQISLGKP